MPSWLDSNASGLARDGRSGSWAELLGRVADILSVCARARAAAQHYEELKPLSDQALAMRGLTRSEVPRAAFDKLADGR